MWFRHGFLVALHWYGVSLHPRSFVSTKKGARIGRSGFTQHLIDLVSCIAPCVPVVSLNSNIPLNFSPVPN